MRRPVHEAFHEPHTQVYSVVQGIIWVLIFISVALLAIEAVFQPESVVYEIVDRVLLIAFGVEYICRVGSYRPPSLEVFHSGPLVRVRTHVLGRLRYALRPMLLVDLLAVVAVFPGLRGLRALRLLRLLRTIKLFRYSNPFASIFHAFEENSLLFIFGFTVLVSETLIGGVSIYLVESTTNPDIDTLVDGIWWALVTLTTVGFGDITPQSTLGRIIGGVLMVGGMFTLALFAGFVGSSLVNAMLSIREEQFRMGDYANHIVICGYEPTAGELLLDLVKAEFDTSETRVVVFEDMDRPRTVSTDFLWVQGDPTKQSELDKVRLTHAMAVIVVGSRATSPQAADARTILTTFTIRAYLEEHAAALAGRRHPLYVVAEILDSENVNHARTAGADEVIESRRVGFSMLAHTVRYHGTADTMSRLVMSGDYNAYVGVLPDLDETISYQELLIKLQLTKRGGLIIGLRVDGDDVFNPSKDFVVHPGSHVIYLAQHPILDVPL